jgi:hypothetical protein
MPVIAGTVREYHIALGVHVATIIIVFGTTFVRPIAFGLATRHDPRSLAALHRVEYTIGRLLIAPGLLVAFVTGVYMASWKHDWGQFFVWWGIGAITVIAAALGTVMIPTTRRAWTVAERDTRASVGGAIDLSGEYRALTRRLAAVSSLLSAFVLITIFFMGINVQ